jgi:uncharacterized protein YcfJ
MIGVVFLSGLLGCRGMDSRQQTHTVAGAGIGALTGGILDHHNRWRGAGIGALAGGLLGYALTPSSPTYVETTSPSPAPVYSTPTYTAPVVKFCPNCGRTYAEGVNFCSLDGQQLRYRQ